MSIRTRIARTPSGGFHYYFWSPLPLGNTVGRLCRGVDTRGEGGYVVAPPSQIAGKAYEWVDSSPAAELPGWLVERLKPARREARLLIEPRVAQAESRLALRIIAEEASRVANAPKGERNNTLFKAAASLASLAAGGELRFEVALAELRVAGQRAGLLQLEVERTIQSARHRGSQEPRRIRNQS